MKVKLFDCEDEKDLEEDINNFLLEDIIMDDIKFSVSSSIYGEEQIYCFSALVVYHQKKWYNVLYWSFEYEEERKKRKNK